MIKILFVCHGNICRSPMAEFVMKKLVREAGREREFEIASAATSREEMGNDIYPPAKRCLSAHGIPYEKHAARQILPQDVLYYDYIVAMEAYNLRNLRRLLGSLYTQQEARFSLLLDFADRPGEVADPWYSGDFETAFRDIERGCRGLLKCTRGPVLPVQK
ncbi:MAG: low molecular weight phosphotyrosine protein phosphatase [Lachnospiraceae bacterium]|nr:low molecular weight phosphotyrosine protein phosphatase [Lachnospiraceae bacterium]